MESLLKDYSIETSKLLQSNKISNEAELFSQTFVSIMSNFDKTEARERMMEVTREFNLLKF